MKLAGESGITLCTRWLYLIAASDAGQRKVKDVNAKGAVVKAAASSNAATVHYVLYTTVLLYTTAHYCTLRHARTCSSLLP